MVKIFDKFLRACPGSRRLRIGEDFSSIRQEAVAADIGDIGKTGDAPGGKKDRRADPSDFPDRL